MRENRRGTLARRKECRASRIQSEEVAVLMIVKYHGESSPVGLVDDKDYEVISIVKDVSHYR